MRWSQFMFYTVLLCVVVLLYTTTSVHCNNHTVEDSNCLTIGRRGNEDELLFNETIIEEKSTTNPVVSKDIRLPPLTDTGCYLFLYIKVEGKGKGGYVNCTSGGLNKGFVNLHLESQEGKGFEFHVLIYGYKYA